jgi:hypothetical protein
MSQNVREAKADDQTYVYVKGDGTWITEGSVRSYDAGDFTLIQERTAIIRRFHIL